MGLFVTEDRRPYAIQMAEKAKRLENAARKIQFEKTKSSLLCVAAVRLGG